MEHQHSIRSARTTSLPLTCTRTSMYTHNFTVFPDAEQKQRKPTNMSVHLTDEHHHGGQERQLDDDDVVCAFFIFLVSGRRGGTHASASNQ